MKKSVNLLIVFLIIIIAFSCSKTKCPPMVNNYYKISEKDFEKVPYRNFSELTFVNVLTNDTHIFKSQNWDTSYKHLVDNDIQCPYGAYYQKLSLDFMSNNLKSAGCKFGCLNLVFYMLK